MIYNAVRAYRLSPVVSLVGAGARDDLGNVVAKLGRRAIVLGGHRALAVAEDAVSRIAEAGCRLAVREFRGECTQDAIDALAQAAVDAEVLVGVGGGKALDTAKAAAASRRIPCVTLPTSAATCAAYTPLSILHREDGSYVESRRLSAAVAAMILDVELIGRGPSRLLAAGIVDALARALDTDLAARVAVPSATAALSLGACRAFVDVLREDADSALASRETRPPAMERAIEACIVGAGLAGETGARFFGRSFSHAVAYALSERVDPVEVLHGEAVGLGVLVHCALDAQAPLAYETVQGMLSRWELPRTFSALGVEASDEAGRTLARRTLDYLDREHAIPFEVDEASLLRAFLRVDATL
ncbi:MAG: iron-containing alcohol dehydrogenase [Candidatus Bipolaricaulota bacterium]